MQMFIANCTKQRQIFFYRTEYDRDEGIPLHQQGKSAKQIEVLPGQQRMVGDFAAPIVRRLMDQIRTYGGVPVEEIGHIATGRNRYVTWLVGTDHSIKADAIRDVLTLNEGGRIEEGQYRREAAAVAAGQDAARVAAEHMAHENVPEDTGTLGAPMEVEMKTLTDVDDGTGEEGKTRIDEKFKVDHSVDNPNRKQAKGGRRR